MDIIIQKFNLKIFQVKFHIHTHIYIGVPNFIRKIIIFSKIQFFQLFFLDEK